MAGAPAPNRGTPRIRSSGMCTSRATAISSRNRSRMAAGRTRTPPVSSRSTRSRATPSSSPLSSTRRTSSTRKLSSTPRPSRRSRSSTRRGSSLSLSRSRASSTRRGSTRRPRSSRIRRRWITTATGTRTRTGGSSSPRTRTAAPTSTGRTATRRPSSRSTGSSRRSSPASRRVGSQVRDTDRSRASSPAGQFPQGEAAQDDGLRQPGAHQAEPAGRPLRTAPRNTGSWDPDEDEDGPDPRDHAFFADHDDDDAPEGAGGGRRAGKSQSKGGRKRRSGCACLVVVLVLGGGLGGGGYFGYNLYQSHFGPAPDYSGQGSGDVQVEIPDGATATTMGNLLKTAGVVKSVEAFTDAAGKNPKGSFIQSGVYILHKQMSGSAAVTMMLDPNSQNSLIIAEGLRATEIYKEIDDKLGLKEGTTAADLKGVSGVNLGLPSWAKDNVEGFLFPAKYSVAQSMKPVDLVKEMVSRANSEFTKIDLEGNAEKVGKTPEEIL